MISHRKNTVFTVFFVHSAIITAALIFMIFTGKDYVDYLLRDDGYYRIAAQFLSGKFCAGFGPGLPFIFMPIHLFPDSFHPFIRVLISQAVVLCILILLSRLTKDILSNRQFFLGALLVVLHPAFLHWSFRTSIDLYLTLMLLGFILFFIKYDKERKYRYLVVSLLFFGFGVFIRPSFIIIPFFLIIAVLLFKKIRGLIWPVIVLILFSTLTFYLNNMYIQKCRKGEIEITADTGRSIVIFHSFWLTKTILEKKQFHKGTVDSYEPDNINENQISGARELMEQYDDDNLFKMIGNYAKENPVIFGLKFLLSPVFYFSLASRQAESYLLLFITIGLFILSIKGIVHIFRRGKHTRVILLILIIAAGYAVLHWITHSYSRYSLPLIPLLFVWGGIYFDKLKFKKNKNLSIEYKQNDM